MGLRGLKLGFSHAVGVEESDLVDVAFLAFGELLAYSGSLDTCLLVDTVELSEELGDRNQTELLLHYKISAHREHDLLVVLSVEHRQD